MKAEDSTPVRYIMDLTDKAIEARMKATPGFVTVEDTETDKTVVMFSTGLPSRLINDMFDFMRAWPTVTSQSSELSKLREDLHATERSRKDIIDRKIDLEQSLTERDAEIEKLKFRMGEYEHRIIGQSKVIAEKTELAFDRSEIIVAKDKEIAELRKDLREIQKSNAKIQILIVESDIDYEIMLTSEEVQRQSKLISAALDKPTKP